MAIYQVLDPPAGTFAFPQRSPSPLEQIAPIAQKAFGEYNKQSKVKAFREAAAKEGLTPEYKQDPATGEYSINWKKPVEKKTTTKTPSVKDTIKAFLAGIGPAPEGIAPEEAPAIRDEMKKKVSADMYLRSYLGVPEEKPPKEVKPPKPPTFEQRAKEAIAGAITWDQLQNEFPIKLKTIKEMKPAYTPIDKNPNFKEGKGLQALFSKDVANLSGATKRVISNIKTQADYDDLVANQADYEAEGVDVEGIKEYFGRR